MSAPDIREVPLDKLSLGIQSREAINDEVVAEYAEAMADGYGDFPPVEGYEDADGTLHLFDGHHRMHAARQKGLVAVPARIYSGGRADAVWAAAAANARHGLRRTSADKRKAIALVLLCPQGRHRSNNAIAKQVGCDGKTVKSVRDELIDEGKLEPSTTRIGADGRCIETRRIGPGPATEDAPTSEIPKSDGASPGDHGQDRQPSLTFGPDRHAESPEEPDNSPVSPPAGDASSTPDPAHDGDHDAPCATCGAEPCDCRRVATPDGDPDPDVPPEIDEGAPPWEGGPADHTDEGCNPVASNPPPDGLHDAGLRLWHALELGGRPVHALARQTFGMFERTREAWGRLGAYFTMDRDDERALLNPNTPMTDITKRFGVIRDELTVLMAQLPHFVPARICSDCHGNGCPTCNGRGFAVEGDLT